MATNPLVDQGVVNRIRGSVVIPLLPALNISAPYLGKEGISLTLEGETTTYLPTLTGGARSPEPYQMAAIVVELLKTQALSSAFKAQMELDAFIGDITVRPDSSPLAPYVFTNCSIGNVERLLFNGTTAAFMISLKGIYIINQTLWNL
jgi:hypothetical protein